MYLCEKIGDEYRGWLDKKIIISTPTGSGKTTFVLKKLLPFYRERGKKLLILCNRKILELQYGYAMAENFTDFREEKNVQIVTYQKMATELREGLNIEEKYAEFDGVCLDECHYFVADAEFNSFGTAAVWGAVKKLFWTKQMIFMSATMENMLSFIEEFIEEIKKNVPERIQPKPSYMETLRYTFDANYNHILPIFVPNKETLCQKLHESKAKSLVFINDCEIAEQMKKKLIALGEEPKSVALLNSEKLQAGKMDEIVETMALGHKLLPRILITTSVLDNGISIHDKDVRNICIISEQKTSFLQMLGRVRMSKEDGQINLYLLNRPLGFYRKRAGEMKRKIEMLELFERRFKEDKFQYQILNLINEGVPEADLFRNLTYWTPDWTININCTWKGKRVLKKNRFAIANIRQQYLDIRRQHVALVQDVYGVAKEQVSWLGILWESVKIEESVDVEKELKKELKKELLSRDYPMKKAEFQEIREFVAKEYFGVLYSDIILRTRPLSKEKMEKICEDLGLVLETSKSGKSYCYKIKRREKNE